MLVESNIKEKLRDVLFGCLKKVSENHNISLDEIGFVEIDRPANLEHGDYATNLPLRLTKQFKNNPMVIADQIVSEWPETDFVSDVSVAAPGFINFKLDDQWLQNRVTQIIEDGSCFGDNTVNDAKHVMIEFVSVNPTGPVHVGHARGAVIGSSLANIMSAAGYRVTREYYINDAGNQMQLFFESVLARYRELLGIPFELPEGGYQGDYIKDVAELVHSEFGDSLIDNPEAINEMAQFSTETMLNAISDDLCELRVEFDNWFSEKSLFGSDEYTDTIGELESKSYLKEMDSALWFVSTMLEEEKDNVIVKSTGEPTYFASDIAYHRNKFKTREFDQVIDIWGADHQGHISRLKAAMRALDIDDSKLKILISQMVTLKQGDEIVKASKRTGDFVTVKELVEEVGSDACRYFFLTRSASSQMEFDMELAKKTSNENPVYYIQYAHARIKNILALASDNEIDWYQADLSLLNNIHELNLIKALMRLPEVIYQVADSLEPHHMPHYALELASYAHAFYEHCRVISSNPDDEAITKARLRLIEAAQVVFEKSLNLMGMDAPDRM